MKATFHGHWLQNKGRQILVLSKKQFPKGHTVRGWNGMLWSLWFPHRWEYLPIASWPCHFLPCFSCFNSTFSKMNSLVDLSLLQLLSQPEKASHKSTGGPRFPCLERLGIKEQVKPTPQSLHHDCWVPTCQYSKEHGCWCQTHDFKSLLHPLLVLRHWTT